MEQTTTKTIKVRRANTASPEELMPHFTLTRVENQPDKCFGFAISDDGETEIYIPAKIIKDEQMTSADVNAGFRCRTRPAGRDATGHPAAVHPLKWDGAAEEVEVEVEVADVDIDQINQDMDDLVKASSTLLDDVLGPVEQLASGMDQMIQAQGRLFAEMKKLRDNIHKFKAALDEIAPENE